MKAKKIWTVIKLGSSCDNLVVVIIVVEVTVVAAAAIIILIVRLVEKV